jgi:hypothetical protein
MAKPLTQPASPHGKGQVSAGLENNNIKPFEEELDSNNIKQLEQQLEYRNQDFNDALTSWIKTDSFFPEEMLDDHLQYISYSYADTIAFFLYYHNTSILSAVHVLRLGH